MMPLYFSSLNSGSNGNCYYVGNQREAVLIDAGLSCRETEKRIARSGLEIDKIKAVFISHEHSDHTNGVEVFSRKYGIPVFISRETYSYSKLKLGKHLVRNFNAGEQVSIGGLSVNAFPKSHDAVHPHSFTVSGSGFTVGVLTDIGSACEHVVVNFAKCHAAFLEANYDDEMLENGRYPIFLKKRIRGDQGHLSNLQALELFVSHKAAFMSHLLLSHLSQENNNPRLVHELFSRHAGETHISVASRHRETEVFCLREDKLASRTSPSIRTMGKPTQLTLF